MGSGQFRIHTHIVCISNRRARIVVFGFFQEVFNQGPILGENLYEFTSFQLLLYIMKVKSHRDQ